MTQLGGEVNELSERAKKLRGEIGIRFSTLVGAIIRGSVAEQEQLEAALVSEIEQALLAERRLAMEESARICDAYSSEKWKRYKTGRSPERANPYTEGESDAAETLSRQVRAAAEKEVGTK